MVFRLAHISDLHLTPPPARGIELEPKRWLSRFAWRRKRRRHSQEALATLVADLKAQRPDHIVITGDLTNFATSQELRAARVWLESLAPADQVTVSPGNHDALAGAGGHERFAPWAPWLGDADEAEFPQVRVRGPVALVNLCSATPTALHLAQGVLDAAQLQRLPQLLRRLRGEGLFRVLLIHHPPSVGVVSRRKALRQAPELAEILCAEGCELVLHGHAHEASMSTLAGPQGLIPVLGVPPASGSGAHGETARWHEVEIEAGEEWRVRVTARGLGADGRMAELGRYRLHPTYLCESRDEWTDLA
ncbi:MAG TPA: metallophosphoesterase [Phenylobacterium sp.]|uniref:metallophosphoesterase family protein n=1 Tax=Phenylobacterium sp. TaxID=1871053 RepID=UPI002B495521|nr:metallophosphoesterase [Phenylobacterium sp.]HKR89687.1 metallophosphoesterase [Phenylobacterium sp.]